MGPESGRHLVDWVAHWAEVAPDDKAFTFVDFTTSREGTAVVLTYGELRSRAEAVGSQLLKGWTPQVRVAILCPQGLDYIVAFLGCLYAGVVAVPLFVPEAGQDITTGDARLTAILDNCEPATVLTTSGHQSSVGELAGRLTRRPRVVAVDRVTASWAGPVRWPRRLPSEPAYVQYTSGSTTAPRGVRVTHGNLTAALDQMRRLSTRVMVPVVWTPYFHDMGLIAGIAMPLSVGAHSVHMDPAAFVQRPYRWLRLISDYRGSMAVAPNFGYDLCVRTVTQDEKGTLDLSSVKFLGNGSEAVRSDSLAAFGAAFAESGLAAHAQAPGYGLAEATLVVTAGRRDGRFVTLHVERGALAEGQVALCSPDHPGAREVVGCGRPVPAVDLVVVDPELGVPQAPERVGEIWVSGPNVADGYWRDPQRTREVFGARLPDDPHTYLRTGDLGFLHEGMLFIVGRHKELIIVDGRNHYPADLEQTAAHATPVLRAGSLAAFSVDRNGGECLVVVAEAHTAAASCPAAAAEQAAETVRRSVARTHGIDVYELVLVSPDSLPRTASGKIRRAACREAYVAGGLSRLAG